MYIDTNISTCVHDTRSGCEIATVTHCICRYGSTMFVLIVWSMYHITIRTMSIIAAVVWQSVGWGASSQPSSSCLHTQTSHNLILYKTVCIRCTPIPSQHAAHVQYMMEAIVVSVYTNIIYSTHTCIHIYIYMSIYSIHTSICKQIYIYIFRYVYL